LGELDGFRIAHLATADQKAQPLVVPICFACRQGRIYSVIDQKPKRLPPSRLRRVKNIRLNPHVCLVADHYEEDWRRLSYILVEGAAKLLTRGREHDAALRLLRKKYPQYRAMILKDRPVIKITPQRLITWKAG
jgi:coenzyme F420-0:L-glutamate ligase/coenzyme F420-1:gamma-L-glutamate ligase